MISFISARTPSIKENTLKIHRALPAVLELNGFLNALRCIIDCPNRAFGACLIQKDTDLTSIVQDAITNINSSGKVLEDTQLGYKLTYRLFIDLIYKRISPRNKRALDNLDWNLIEYYGLISTADQEDGPWNRFISQEHRVLRFIGNDGGEYVIFFVEYSDFVVETQLGVSWSHSNS